MEMAEGLSIAPLVGPYDTVEKQTLTKTSRPTTISTNSASTRIPHALEKLIKGMTIEDRVYRMRCVEAWSMVIPWQGFALSELIKLVEPMSQAKYVEFHTL